MRKNGILLCSILTMATLTSVLAKAEDNHEYYITKGMDFHNGLAYMYLTYDFEDYFWGVVDKDFKLVVNLKEQYGYDSDNMYSSNRDKCGNDEIRLDDDHQLVFYDGGARIEEVLTEDKYIKYYNDGYFVFMTGQSAGYQFSETQYGVLDPQGNTLLLSTEDELEFPLDEVSFSNAAITNYRNFFIGDGKIFNVETNELVANTDRGSFSVLDGSDGGLILVANGGDLIEIYNSNWELQASFPNTIYYQLYLGDTNFISDSIVAITYDGSGCVYKTDGTKIFEGSDLGNVSVMNISPTNDGYSVLLLEGTEYGTNYITVIDPDGKICYDPVPTILGTDSDRITIERDISGLLSGNHILSVPTKDCQIFYNLDGEQVFEIDYADSALNFSDGYVCSQYEGGYYDESGNFYHIVHEN